MRGFAARAALALFAAVLVVAPAGATEKKKKGTDLVLKDGFPPISAEEKALTEVPFAPGAPAVVLLQAEQLEQQVAADDVRQRIAFYRRVKILTQAGVEEYSSWSQSYFGRWRLEKLQARTILPDGREIDAKEGMSREQSEGTTHDAEYNTIKVTWPQVQVGAILDLFVTSFNDYIPAEIYYLQEDIPVLDNRLVMQVASGFQFATLGELMTQEEGQPISFKYARGQTHAWQWVDMPAVGNEPLSPPIQQASKRLIVYPVAFREGNFKQEWATDWKKWNHDEKVGFVPGGGWDSWIKIRTNAADALAKEVAGDKATATEKAEAIRQALRSRVRSAIYDYIKSSPSVDDVLTRGYGTTSEIAALAVEMLKAVDVPSELCFFRRRSEGNLPTQVPLDILMDDAMVRFRGEKGLVYFDPIGSTPVGPVPFDARGQNVIVLDGVSAAPIRMPPLGAMENRTVRVVKADVDAQGNVKAEGTLTYFGLAATRWKNSLRERDETKRMELVRDGLRRFMPGTTVDALEIEGLDDTKELVLKVKWSVEAYAQPAGKKMLVNLSLFERHDPADWASDTRINDIDFVDPFDHNDTISVTFPEGAGEITVPGATNANAPPVGRFASVHTKAGKVVTFRRMFRVDTPRVPVTAWTGLKSWFRDMAKADDQPVVVDLP